MPCAEPIMAISISFISELLRDRKKLELDDLKVKLS